MSTFGSRVASAAPHHGNKPYGSRIPSQTERVYSKLKKYVATQRQLSRHGYPRPGPSLGTALLNDTSPEPINPTRKVCIRCSKAFTLNETPSTSKGRCTYHSSRPYGGVHRCCNRRVGSKGCRVAKHHVHADNRRDPRGYITVERSWLPGDDCPGVFAVDCEMSFTVVGLELTRVTVVNHECEIVYDTLVKPFGKVLDYNTEWSGISEDDMRNVTTTLDDVQEYFQKNFSSHTILIGHSLECDLMALRLIHETVVDTSLVFTHKRGLPHKRSLRSLSLEHLGLEIQIGEHDSYEDASACMKIMMKKIGYCKI